MSCPHGYADGAYVLGALNPAERAEFEEHLAQCPECAVAVGRLAPLPGLLGRVDPAALQEDPPDPGQLARLLNEAAASRRRQVLAHRWRLALAALAAALLAGGGAAMWAGAPDPPPPAARSPQQTERLPAPEEMRRVAAASWIVAHARVQQTPGGSSVWVRCRYPVVESYRLHDSPRTFRLVAVGVDGSVEQVGSWRAGPGEQVELTGLTRFGGADLGRVELRNADGVTLLVHEP